MIVSLVCVACHYVFVLALDLLLYWIFHYFFEEARSKFNMPILAHREVWLITNIIAESSKSGDTEAADSAKNGDRVCPDHLNRDGFTFVNTLATHLVGE